MSDDYSILYNYSIKELQAEIDRKLAIEKKAKNEAFAHKTEVLMNNINTLIFLTEHDRTSCSNENPCNVGRCTKCDLIRARRDGYWDDEFDIKIMTVKRLES